MRIPQLFAKVHEYTHTDHCSKAGAQLLASRVASFWIKHGYPKIRTRIERVYFEGMDKLEADGRQHWGVRSNIGPLGYPPQ